MYKIKIDEHGSKIIIKEMENSVISFGEWPANTDYQEYLRFLAEGGQPLPADDDGQTAE